MLPGWSVVLAALVYLFILFAVAHAADGAGRKIMRGPARTTIYALALAVYCTSWTFYGSVGFANRAGLDFLAIYVGPILVIGLGHRIVARIVRLAKAQNITSIADFVGARYGKSERVAALVTIIAVVAALPYVALQLKAVSSSLSVFIEVSDGTQINDKLPVLGDLALLVALVLAAFAVAFGTRHIDATEHQDGLVVAIALESVVKLVAFLIGGFFVVYWMNDGLGAIVQKTAQPALNDQIPLLERTSSLTTFLTLTLLSAFAALLLPRQFHMAIVENRDERDVRRAAWLFPLYLILINLFVLPIAISGETLLNLNPAERDMTMLLLPLSKGAGLIAMIVFIGGLSAATAMVIVASVALAIMISNHLVMPLVVRGRSLMSQWRRTQSAAPSLETGGGDLGSLVITIRRIAIMMIVLLGYVYYRAAGDAALASIGLLSFAATAQIGPVFVAGLVWRRGTAPGASAGLIAGLLTWIYTLLLPNLLGTDPAWMPMIQNGPFGIAALRPTALFGADLPQLTHGVVFSLLFNILAFMLVSMLRPANAIERLQAASFVSAAGHGMVQNLRLWRSSVTMDELQGTIARYLGADRTRAAFSGFARTNGRETSPTLRPRGHDEADIHAIRFGEHLLASAIGAASSRLVLSVLLKRRNLSSEAAFKLLDDASAALQYNRDLLQHALDQSGQGITVIDKELRVLCWNEAFIKLYDLPPHMMRVGTGLDEIVRFNAESGSYGEGPVDDLVAQRLESFLNDREPVRLRIYPSERVIDIRSNPLPDGGLVTTYTDISDAVAVEEALERRVRERTEELTRVNTALQLAKQQAETANLSKTRFLAAASHDVLQPLNAARLYAHSLTERDRTAGRPELAENVEASLDAVEEILTALLDISRLDAGAMKPEITSFRVDELFRQLQRDFEPQAREKGLKLRFVSTRLTIRSDRRLLRRVLQNLVSNAIKYTPSGKVLVGCRRRGPLLLLKVMDTGLGIPQAKQKAVFREFERLDQGARIARGLGLGLSIVERIASTLGHRLTLRSAPGRGSTFEIAVPRAAGLAAPAPQAERAASSYAPLKGMLIVAIDNEPTIQDGMKLVLGGWGCDVVTAADAGEALMALERSGRAPDAIIADFHLDQGNGIAATLALRDALGHFVPATLLTADRSPEVRAQAEEAGMQILNKPLRPAALRALLSQWRMTRTAAE
ncbi:MAG: hybrid sensor histidine kinase/response regulator [Hyphomicrobiales bacterium]|jgi:Na+/proline symporter/signal transduction histidine kinase|nr:hybrid sensor histidine kinase/response regulator [Hyphomicrobiales bacterium]